MQSFKVNDCGTPLKQTNLNLFYNRFWVFHLYSNTVGFGIIFVHSKQCALIIIVWIEAKINKCL